MNPNSKFEVTITVKYDRGAGNDDESEKFHFAFEPGSTDWQFVSGAFTTKGGAGNLVHEITVSCVYCNHPGISYFDNISVYPCDNDAVQENEYYEDGRLKWSKNGSYMEYYEYDEGAIEDDEDGARPKTYTAINNRGDYIEYHYNSGSVITNSVQMVKRYQYTGNFAYQTENLSETLTKNLRNETVYTYNQFGQLTGESLQYYTKLSDGTAGPPFPNVISSSSSYETAEGSKIFGALTSQTDSLNRTTRYF